MTPTELLVESDCQRARWNPAIAEDHARVGLTDADSLGHVLDGGGFVHAPMSHIVIISARDEFHNLCGDPGGLPWQIVSMSNQAKNGGPNHLKAWREYRKMTQAELAAKVDTNANMIGYLESGERGLSAKWLRKLADALLITPGHLLDHNPNEIPNDILEIWMNADPSVQRQIAEVAKALVRTGTDG